MGADISAKSTPNAPEFISPSPKVLDFNKKGLHLASVIHASGHLLERSVGPEAQLRLK